MSLARKSKKLIRIFLSVNLKTRKKCFFFTFKSQIYCLNLEFGIYTENLSTLVIR